MISVFRFKQLNFTAGEEQKYQNNLQDVDRNHSVFMDGLCFIQSDTSSGGFAKCLTPDAHRVGYNAHLRSACGDRTDDCELDD